MENNTDLCFVSIFAILLCMTRIVDPEILGKRLREERERLGLTQSELADAGSVRRITVYQYERGDRPPSLEFLSGAEKVGVSFDYVLRGERPVPSLSGKFIDAELVAELYWLVDRYAVDAKGRSLHLDDRSALFEKLVSMAINIEGSEVNREAITDELEAFAA